MSETESAEGLVSRGDIAELAVLLDRSEFAIDPTSRECKLAEVEFEDKVKQLHLEKVATVHPSVSLPLFRSRIKSLCRIYLRKN